MWLSTSAAQTAGRRRCGVDTPTDEVTRGIARPTWLSVSPIDHQPWVTYVAARRRRPLRPRRLVRGLGLMRASAASVELDDGTRSGSYRNLATHGFDSAGGNVRSLARGQRLRLHPDGAASSVGSTRNEIRFARVEGGSRWRHHARWPRPPKCHPPATRWRSRSHRSSHARRQLRQRRVDLRAGNNTTQHSRRRSAPTRSREKLRPLDKLSIAGYATPVSRQPGARRARTALRLLVRQPRRRRPFSLRGERRSCGELSPRPTGQRTDVSLLDRAVRDRLAGRLLRSPRWGGKIYALWSDGREGDQSHAFFTNAPVP